MSINLQKGQKIDLSKGGAGGTGLHRVMVGLGWDEAPRSGGGLFGLRQPQPIDCDASGTVYSIFVLAVCMALRCPSSSSGPSSSR